MLSPDFRVLVCFQDVGEIRKDIRILNCRREASVIKYRKGNYCK